MKRAVVIGAVILLGGLTTSCVPKATEKECEQMCRNLVKLRGEVDLEPVDQRIADVEKDYEEKKKELETRKEQALKALDTELEEAVAEAEDEEAKEKLKKDYAAKKEAKGKEIESMVQSLGPEKEKEIAEVKKEAEQAEAKAQEKIAECTQKCIAEGVTQKVANCRIKATSVDEYWNRCR